MRISRDEMLVRIAEVVRERSTCGRKQVGAVLAVDGRPVSIGYAGAPSGLPHCSETCDLSQPCTRTVHAEMNCLVFAARHGIKVEGSTVYCTLEPCLKCSQAMLNAGVARVVFTEAYRDHAGVELLRSVGIEVMQWIR